MTHGSLFSGIGGFDLAAEWMGWDNLFHCEWNEFGQKILHYYWPNAEQFTDITKSNFTKYANKIDILTGGFPCQPYSLAGKRKGKEDERHLWPHMLRAIREIQPRWVVGENVLGLINWNGGLVFNEVQADLEAAGYEVWPYVLPACSVGAPHRRDRVWFVARRKDVTNPDSDGQHGSDSQYEIDPSKRGQYAQRNVEPGGCNGVIANPESNGDRRNPGELFKTEGKSECEGPWNEFDGSIKNDGQRFDTNPTGQQGERTGFEQREYSQQEQGRFGGNSSQMGNWGNATDTVSIRGRQNEWERIGESNVPYKINAPGNWDNFPTQSPVCSRNDGVSSRLDGITFSKWRNESIKAYGNAIVPQVALQIFRAIELYDRKTLK